MDSDEITEYKRLSAEVARLEQAQQQLAALASKIYQRDGRTPTFIDGRKVIARLARNGTHYFLDRQFTPKVIEATATLSAKSDLADD